MNQTIDFIKYEKKLSTIGKTSFILSLIALILTIVGGILIAVRFFPGILVLYSGDLIMVIGLVLGAVSFSGPYKNIYALIGFILGIVALCVGSIFKFISFGFLF